MGSTPLEKNLFPVFWKNKCVFLGRVLPQENLFPGIPGQVCFREGFCPQLAGFSWKTFFLRQVLPLENTCPIFRILPYILSRWRWKAGKPASNYTKHSNQGRAPLTWYHFRGFCWFTMSFMVQFLWSFTFKNSKIQIMSENLWSAACV